LITDRKERFSHLTIIDADSIGEPEEMNETLNRLYPDSGDAGNVYRTSTGNVYVVMNSNENRNSAQFFSIKPRFTEESTVSVLEGALGIWQYLVFWQREGVFHIMASASGMASMNLCLHCRERPHWSVLGEGINARWDALSLILELVIDGTDRTVELLLSLDPEKDLNLLYVGIHNPPDTNRYLSDLPFYRVETRGPFLPIKGHCANSTYGVLPMSMNGLRYPKGFSFMRRSEVSFSLGASYTGITLTAGFDIDAWMPIIIDRDHIIWDRHSKDINLYLSIYGDGKELYRSENLRRTDWRKVLDLDVHGIDILSFHLEGDVVSDIPGVEVYMDIGNPILRE
jgi:hypothetical protein